MDSYNIAFNYLKGKYGSHRVGLTFSAQYKLRTARNKVERNNIENSFTDSDYCVMLNPVPETNNDDQEIRLLLNQYYLGYGARIDLENKLITMKIIE